jgi:hypothetical protein
VFFDKIRSETVYYSEVHWVSKCKALQHFISLLEEIRVFCVEKGQPVSHFQNARWVFDLSLTDICWNLNGINSKLQEQCQLVNELYNSVLPFKVKLSLFHSELLNNNICHSPNCQKTFQQYKTNSDQYVRHIEQLHQSFTDRFVDFDQVRGLFKTFTNPLEA